MQRKHQYYDSSGNLLDEAAALENGIIKDGVRVVTPVFMKDGLPMQLHDGLNGPAGRKQGFVFCSDAANNQRKAENRDFARAELAARYKGGLQVGDRVQICDREHVVVGHNDENGKPLLREVDATRDTAAAIKAAHDEHEAALTSAWQTDGRKVAQRDPKGRLKSTFEEEPDEDDQDKEFKLGGPLSDGQDVRDAAYAEYEQNLQNAWKR